MKRASAANISGIPGLMFNFHSNPHIVLSLKGVCAGKQNDSKIIQHNKNGRI